MPGEMLEAYRRLERRQYLMVVCVTISTILTLILLITYLSLVRTHTQTIYSYLNLQQNYTSFTASSAKQISALEHSLALLSGQYNQSVYNLTNPYTMQLYSNREVSIPASATSASVTKTNNTKGIETFNTTYVQKYYAYNFTLNATYPGYLLLNATSTGANSGAGTNWEFIVSNGKPVSNNTLEYSNFESGTYAQGPYSPTVTGKGTYAINFNVSQPYSVYAPLPAESSGSVRIPVNNGTVRVWIVNFENKSITTIFSAEYVGFHTN